MFLEGKKNKMCAKWQCGFKLVEIIQPDSYAVSNGKKRYRFN
jgi:hypothetical protein